MSDTEPVTLRREQLRQAAYAMHTLTVDTPVEECPAETQADMEVQAAAFRAAGFRIEGYDDE